MKIGRQSHNTTSISASNPQTIIVRGYDLVEQLIGRISFTDHVWLLVTGALPTEGQRRVLDATLVAIAEHGIVPSVQAARLTFAAAPEAMQGAVAAGLLGCGSVILGSSQAAGQFFTEISEAAKGQDIGSAAREVVARYRAEKRAIPGYGHPLHKGGDARAMRLFAVAQEVGLGGEMAKIAHVVEGLMPELTGKSLLLNVSGAIPAVLLDAGYPLLALKGAPLLARTASLIAHLLEEQTQPIGFVMAHAGSAAIGYDGPAPDGFTPNEN